MEPNISISISILLEIASAVDRPSIQCAYGPTVNAGMGIAVTLQDK